MKTARLSGDIVMLGITQEQHAERCRLFAQWKQFDWPIVQDPINKLGLAAVPVLVELDEHGVTKSLSPTVASVKASLASGATSKETSKVPAKTPNIKELRDVARRDNSYAAWLELGDALVLWGGERSAAGKAIEAYENAKQLAPAQAEIHFRLGVAHRMLHDSPQNPAALGNAIQSDPIAGIGLTKSIIPEPSVNHFRLAVEHWGQALELNPNQYIYRRRIEQYGPRLIKPYPFYDWIRQAQNEIAARGDAPIELQVEASGSELASPAKEISSNIEDKQSPDPEGKINRDNQQHVVANAVVVPARVRPGDSVCVHVTFEPQANAHWNNESDPLLFWVEVPDGWTAERQWFQSAMPDQAESSEKRSFEFELKTPRLHSTTTTLKAYALYHVCETTRGACLFVRQDVEIPIVIKTQGQ